MGHAQSGGWSIFLPNDVAAESRALTLLDARFPVLLDVGSSVFLPPQASDSSGSLQQAGDGNIRARGSDWATANLEHAGVELDALPEADRRLWSFQWSRQPGLLRELALTTALFIQLIGFGEGLVNRDDLCGLEWRDVLLAEDGLLLSLRLRGAVGRLQVWAGAAERLLLDQLRACSLPRPFTLLDLQVVDQVAAWLFDRLLTLD
jgi:hypothetical protein